MKKAVILFLKGLLIGICDLIPGISGGTIAFITGIYDRLINAIKNFSPKLIIDFFKYLLKRDKESLLVLKEGIKKLDILFLIILVAGIATAILSCSRVMIFLLKNYATYTLSFFVGLILASSKSVYGKIEKHHTKNKLFGILGLLVGISFAFIIPVNTNPRLLYVFFGGFLAINAMFLPGISGAFVLLVLGLYKFMLNALHNIQDNITIIATFMLGALFGAFTISRIISFLFKKDKCKTLYFLLGLVIGCLSIPIKEIIKDINLLNTLNMFNLFLFLILGSMLSGGIERLNFKNEEKNKT